MEAVKEDEPTEGVVAARTQGREVGDKTERQGLRHESEKDGCC